jgi:hypothetical protein
LRQEVGYDSESAFFERLWPEVCAVVPQPRLEPGLTAVVVFCMEVEVEVAAIALEECESGIFQCLGSRSMNKRKTQRKDIIPLIGTIRFGVEPKGTSDLLCTS